MSNSSTVFIAYGSNPPKFGDTIEQGSEAANGFSTGITYQTWKQNDIIGLDLVSPIIENIEASEFVVADISTLNFNVVYEIGYAIGCGKRVLITRNAESLVGHDELNRIGIFDTLGYQTYATEMEFASAITTKVSERTIPLDYPKNFAQPLYLISCASANELSQRIASRVKKSRLKFRSFTPSEDIRLSAPTAIENIASSLGLILEWRTSDDEVSFRHNIRTAFAAGLGHALSVETVIFAPPNAMVPLDFRNSTYPVARPEHVDDGLALFVPGVNAAFQTVSRARPRKASKLADTTLGDPAAENELHELHRYFLPSAAYSAAIKGNVRTIVGRKGAGKTALWARIRSHLRSKRQTIVVDLKPEGYQLVKLREEVLEHLSYGQKLHLATAFWEYLLMLEVATRIVETDKHVHGRNPRLTEGYLAISAFVSEYSDMGDSDFSERLHKLSVGLAGRLSKDREVMLGKFNGATLTNKIYAIDIKNFRSQLFEYLAEKNETWILFDNLDRGWPVHGLEDVDFVILRALIDASRKLEREFSKNDIALRTIVFIRDDIYSELVQRTSDFGKEQPHKIDWSDADQLRELLRLRLLSEQEEASATFADAWSQICCSHHKGEETSQYLIERSMMRPRNLLNLINHCRSTAINMRHVIIEEDDLEKGVSAYSTDLLVELSREMEDVLPEYQTLLWDFVRSPQHQSNSDIADVFERSGVPEHERERVMSRLFYYGFIGILVNGEERYIYNFNYEINLILANVRKSASDTIFCIHPAFRDSLDLT